MFSERQLTALANMEAFLKRRQPRPPLTDREAFEAYWELLTRRCEAARRAQTTATPASRAADREARQQRLTAYYQTLPHLLAYGQQYRQRYQPSLAKLRQQLVLKGADAVLVEQVMEQLSSSMDDARRAGEVAEMLQQRGDHAAAIRVKLRQRLFTNETIEHCLDQLSAATGSVLEAAALTRKIQKLQRKGMSQQAMRSRLMGQAGDRPIVQAALNETGGEEQALRRAIERLQRRPLAPRVLIQRLLGKGFRYADIVRVIAEPPAS
jgi:SOS response regulatory protein OraA/RecX